MLSVRVEELFGIDWMGCAITQVLSGVMLNLA
jgi:hypothetical protein